MTIVAPAAASDPERLEQGAKILESFGLVVERPPEALPLRYLAEPDADRARRLTEAFEDPGVKAVIAARGGYGAARLLGRFHASIAAAYPKIFVGYSDLTLVLWRLRAEAGLVSYHGPMAASDLPRLDEAERERFRRFLFGQDGWWAGSDLECFAPGTGSGPLVGGCLSVLVTTLGTPYEVDTRGGVLFLEDTGEPPYRIDRMLTQLLHAGKLDRTAAIVLGRFRDCEEPDRPGMLREVLDEILTPLGVPVVAGFDAGHGSGCAVLPMGCEVKVDARAGLVELLEPVFGGARKQPRVATGQPDVARIAAAALRRGPSR